MGAGIRGWWVPALLLAVPVAAQTGIEGHVRDAAGRPLATAGVLLRSADSTLVEGVATDRLGRYRFTVAAGQWIVAAELIGYAPASRTVTVIPGAMAVVDLTLEESAVALPGVGVEVSRARERFESQAGATTSALVQAEVKRLPGLGEADVLRAVEILPGVVSTSDYTSAFNVRGGSADQNLILLDGIPIYNPFHLGGLFSVFNADMVGRAELLAGGFPAEYGGRVASVLTIESQATGSGTDADLGVSLLATRAAFGADAPDVAGLRNIRVRGSVRRSYFDALFAPFFDFPYHLTDVQLFAEAWTPGGGRLTFTGYTGRDVLNFAQADTTFPLRLRWQWGNDLAGIGWTRPLGGGRAFDLRAGVTRFDTGIRFPDFADTDIRGRIDQWLVRADLDALASETFDLRTGVQLDHLSYDNLAVSGGTEFGSGDDAGWLLAGYAQTRWRPSPAWLLEAGLRFDQWLPESGTNPSVLGPRIAVKRFVAGGDAAIKLAVGRFGQFVHSVRDEELPLGIDVWVLSGDRAPHVVSDQVQAGVEAFLPDDWYAALEAYYRDFDGVVANNFANDPNDATDDLVDGTGESYGADLLVRRDGGRLRPAVAISWLKATRAFPDPDSGLDPVPIVTIPPIFDRRLDVELVLQAVLGNGWELGARWNLGTGLPYTRPLASYRQYNYELSGDGRRSSEDDAGEGSAVVLGPRNAERYPTYHRLDVSARRTFLRGWGSFTPYADVLNVYNRKNPLFYFYEYDEAPPRRSGVSMFPLLPTFGVEIRFF